MKFGFTRLVLVVFLVLLSSQSYCKDKDKDKGKDKDDDPRDGGGISLVQLQQVNFGVLPSGAQRCALNSNGSLVGDCVGEGILGQIEVTGEPYYAYDVTVSDLGWVDEKIFRPTLVSQNYSLNSKGKNSFYVRGEVRFKPKFNQKGLIIFNYQITVNYQ